MEPTAGFCWNPAWLLIAARDPETGVGVLIDGNERASQLQLAVARGAIAPEEIVRTITGDLNLLASGSARLFRRCGGERARRRANRPSSVAFWT